MTDITLTLGATAGILSLKLTSAAAQETSIRLATGNKVNTALDSPTNFFTAQGLNARAAELGNLQDGFTNAIQTLEADANAVKSTKKLLDQMRALADEARKNVAPPDEVSSAILNHSYGAATDTIDTVPALAGKDPFLNVWAGGSTPYLHKFSTDGNTVQDLINGINAASNGVTASFNTSTGKIELDGAGALPMTLGGFEGSSGLEVAIYKSGGGIGNLNQARNISGLNGGSPTGTLLGTFEASAIDFPFGGGADAQRGRLRPFLGPQGDALVDSLGDPNPQGPKVERMVFVIRGKINIPAVGANEFRSFSDDGFQMKIDGTPVVTRTTNTAPALYSNNIDVDGGIRDFEMIWWENGGDEALFAELVDKNGNLIPIGGNLIPTIDPVEPETKYYERATGLQDQITQLVQDSNYLGKTIGENDTLSVALNERGTRLDVQGDRIDTAGLGLDRLSQIDWLSNFDKVDAVLAEAEKKLEAHAAKTANALAILQTRADFNAQIATTLQSGADALIRADINEEGANMLAIQTRSQLASQSLRLSTQADQAVLRLF